MKNATADTGPNSYRGEDVQYVFWDFHILQVILVKRSVIKFSVRLNSRDQ